MYVSVVIPVYNAAKYLEQAVTSALDQPETTEVLLIEDGSTDDSLGVCTRLAASQARVKLLRHPDGENHGAAEARNVGLRAARCDYVSFLDADDYYLGNRFGSARKLLTDRTEIDGVYDAVGTDYHGPGMRDWWKARRQREMSTMDQAVDPDALFESIVGGGSGCFHTNGIVVRRSLFERTGEFDPELKMSQDFAMWIKMSAIGRLVAGSLDKPVAMRRLHGENRIVTNSDEHRQYGFRMWQSLAEWARANKLSPPRRRLLRVAVAHSWTGLSADERRALTGSAKGPRFMLGMLCRHPDMVLDRHFRKMLVRSLGGSTVKGTLRGLARPERCRSDPN